MARSFNNFMPRHNTLARISVVAFSVAILGAGYYSAEVNAKMINTSDRVLYLASLDDRLLRFSNEERHKLANGLGCFPNPDYPITFDKAWIGVPYMVIEGGNTTCEIPLSKLEKYLEE